MNFLLCAFSEQITIKFLQWAKPQGIKLWTRLTRFWLSESAGTRVGSHGTVRVSHTWSDVRDLPRGGNNKAEGCTGESQAKSGWEPDPGHGSCRVETEGSSGVRGHRARAGKDRGECLGFCTLLWRPWRALGKLQTWHDHTLTQWWWIGVNPIGDYWNNLEWKNYNLSMVVAVEMEIADLDSI